MDLNPASIAEVQAVVRAAPGPIVPVGSCTHWEVGGAPAVGPGTEVRAPLGVVDYDPADLTVRVGAGTSVGALQAVLAEADQECVLDPRSDDATIGGLLATGLSGYRRLRFGPLRDRVLEVRFVLADGRVIKGGGPTVKNVSGYDIPRLLVGSFGTLGVISEVVLRCQPLPAARVWAAGPRDPFAVRAAVARPSCIAWDGTTTWAAFEGHPGDLEEEVGRSGLAPAPAGPTLPAGPWRGRMSIPPATIRLLPPPDASPFAWQAEIGVGTVHVASTDTAGLLAARTFAVENGGWMLREAGDGVGGFGGPLPNAALHQRIATALDPYGRMNPGRLDVLATGVAKA